MTMYEEDKVSTTVKNDMVGKVEEKTESEKQFEIMARTQACNEELTAVLNKHKCGLDPTFTIKGNGQVSVQIRIIPKEAV